MYNETFIVSGRVFPLEGNSQCFDVQRHPDGERDCHQWTHTFTKVSWASVKLLNGYFLIADWKTDRFSHNQPHCCEINGTKKKLYKYI